LPLKFEFTIESLVKSIYNIIDLDTLEIIKHFYFPPWNKEMLYNIRISNLSKEKEAKAHLQYLQSIYNSQNISIYIDSLQTLEGRRVDYKLATYIYSL